MAAPGRSITPVKETTHESQIAPEPHVEGESLTTLLSRLGNDVMQLVNSQLTLLKVEMKEDLRAYVTGGIMIAVGGLIALIGFALANVALAFAVSTLFSETNLSDAGRFALGFVLTGVLYLVIGGIMVMVTKSRLAKADLIPDRTAEELRKDKQWLKNEL